MIRMYEISKKLRSPYVPVEIILNGGPYEENEHGGDDDLTEESNQIVLSNFEKKPYDCHPNQKCS